MPRASAAQFRRPHPSIRHIQVRLSLDEYVRLRRAYTLANIAHMSDWLKPYIMAAVDETLAAVEERSAKTWPSG